MNKFICKICRDEHKLETLIEFPQPGIISDISSGRKLVYLKCQLIIDIIDDEFEELELLVWVEVSKEEFTAHMINLKDKDEVTLDGVLVHSIPFYKNKKDLQIKLRFDLNSDFDLPKIVGAKNNTELENGISSGTSLNDWLEKLSELYHKIV